MSFSEGEVEFDLALTSAVAKRLAGEARYLSETLTQAAEK